jgi:DNA-binding CsgD family transcriptional regulator
VEAAKILGITEQTAKNQLHTARLRTGAPTTLALARMFSGELPSVATLRRKARKAA